jgi:hypothetical protein
MPRVPQSMACAKHWRWRRQVQAVDVLEDLQEREGQSKQPSTELVLS